MQFSDTTNKNGLIQRVERLNNLSDGVISGDTTLLSYTTSDINESIMELMLEIMMAQDTFDWDDPTKTDYPVATTPLVANQRDYNFTEISFLKLKRVDVSYDGTTYYRANPFDSASFSAGLGNDTDVDGYFSKTDPKYDPKAFGFWLYPRADATDVANGGKIRIEFTRSFTEFTTSDTSKEPPIDRPFHELIAIGAALKYASIKRLPTQTSLLAMWDQGIADMRRYYADRNDDMDMVLIPQLTDYR